MTFIKIQADTLARAAKRMRDVADNLERQVNSVGPVFEAEAWKGVGGIYGPELGGPGGTDAGPFWLVEWIDGGDGTFGTLRVFSDHPYVMGYEYGVPPHAIDARNVPNLVFWWQKQGVMFVGPHVNHPGYPGRHRSPALARYLTELGRYGWTTAVWSILKDLENGGTGGGATTTNFHMATPSSGGDYASSAEMNASTYGT